MVYSYVCGYAVSSRWHNFAQPIIGFEQWTYRSRVLTVYWFKLQKNNFSWVSVDFIFVVYNRMHNTILDHSNFFLLPLLYDTLMLLEIEYFIWSVKMSVQIKIDLTFGVFVRPVADYRTLYSILPVWDEQWPMCNLFLQGSSERMPAKEKRIRKMFGE